MILIADCGSTKIDWCALDNGKLEKQVFTMGMNAVMLTEEEMRERIGAELMPELGSLAGHIIPRRRSSSGSVEASSVR